ncbi:MAG: dihydrodipicolinate synthase family protein, partial [Candidatus Binataceae bacterium]
EFQITQGCDGLVVAAAAGEPFALSLAERRALLETAVSVTRERVPIVAATGAGSLADTLALTEHANDAGADALLVLPPPFAKPPQRGVLEYFLTVARAANLPMLAYQIPSRTGSAITLDTCEAMVNALPHLVGLKQAEDDRDFVRSALERFGADFRVFMGSSAIAWDMIGEGASGLMLAVGNLVPRELADLCRFAAAGQNTDARAAHVAIGGLNQAALLETTPIGVKYIAARMGLIASSEMRLPLAPPEPALAAMLDAAMASAGLL